MTKQLNKYWQLFWACRRLSLMKLMEYRTDFFFWSFISLLWTLFNLLFYTLIVSVNQNIAGWTLHEMYLLVGVFTIFDAFNWSFLYRNMAMYTDDVYSGELNLVLTKPIDPQFFLMTRYNNFSNFSRVFLGVALIVWSLSQVGQVTLLGIIGFIIAATAGLLFFYFLWFIVSTSSFWVEKIDNINDAFTGIRSVFQVPHQIYTGLVSTFLTVLFPLGLIISVPSELLLGRGSFLLALQLVIAAIIAFLASRWFFFYSIKRFSGVAN